MYCDVIIIIVEASREKDYNKNKVIMPDCLWDWGGGSYCVHAHCRQLNDVHARFLCHILRLLD